MMNNKKKIVCYLFCGLILLLICIFICKRGKITNKIDPSQKEYIEDIMTLELPEKGNIIYYYNTMNEEHYGGEVIVGLELNISGKRKIKKQLKKKDFQQLDSIKTEEWLRESFDLEEEDIEDAYFYTRLPKGRKNPDRNEPFPLSAMLEVCYREENGKFYLYLRYVD